MFTVLISPHAINLLITFYRYHEIFRLLFSPSIALSAQIQSTMKSLNLMQNQYSSVHLRMKYPVGVVKKDGGFLFQKQKALIIAWATNGVNCAAVLHPNATIYVSSDSSKTIEYLLEKSHFARNYTDTTKHKKHQSVVNLVARDYSDENPHINFAKNLEPDGFMSVFEDLFIMGLGKCVAHGIGGYGRLAAALSGGECVMQHRRRKGVQNCTRGAAKTITMFDESGATKVGNEFH